MSDNKPQHALVTGGREDPFLPKLLEAINSATKIRCAVSFIRVSGLELIFNALIDAMERKADIQILTSDYLDITEPQALRRLMLLSERGADIRVFATKPDQGFHIKSYIFTQSEDGAETGCAFVGSSNLSNMALTTGLEWNLRVDAASDPSGFKEILSKFDHLVNHNNVIELSDSFIAAYVQRRKETLRVVGSSNADKFVSAEPNDIQDKALEALADCRKNGFKRGLVVLATGLGKTWLAAFDARQMKAKKVLFVAHREEILLQAEATFSRINSDANIGYYTGNEKELNADFVFASVQTLGAERHLHKFDQDYFDYIVIDEFHHATSTSYRRLIDHFKPTFMLGLTATPERTDQADILALCDNNLVFEKNFIEGIEAKLLSPFQYFGIFDQHVDYTEIPWRSGRFDPHDLENKLVTEARAKHVFKEWNQKKTTQKRTLAFCVSVKHADFMARYFSRKGVRAVAVYSGSTVPRGEALSRLEQGTLDVLFSVDLFNEGMDLPAIDLVLMLRPTESKILYLQQLGRGLRIHDEKPFLLVLDFIGNHKSFFKRPEKLFGVHSHSDIPSAYSSGNYRLPPECFVQFDLGSIEFIKEYFTATRPEYEQKYIQLSDAGEQRPTAVELFRAGVKFNDIRNGSGPKSWFEFVESQSDLQAHEIQMLKQFGEFFKSVEMAAMSKSFKMILLEAFLQLDGFFTPPTIEELSSKSAELLCRRPALFSCDVLEKFSGLCLVENNLASSWTDYWKSNPINAFVGGNNRENAETDFRVDGDRFVSNLRISREDSDVFYSMLRELIDYRLAMYMVSKGLGPLLDRGYPDDPDWPISDAAESTPDD